MGCPPNPENSRVKNLLYHLIFENKAHILNFRPLEPYFTTILGGGGGGVVKTRYNANLSSTATAVGIATGTELGNNSHLGKILKKRDCKSSWKPHSKIF